MISDCICIHGEVVVDGRPVYSDLYPELGEYGFRLWRRQEGEPQQISGEGPHVDVIVVSPVLLINVPRDELSTGARYSFAGPHLGSVARFGGLAARDEGSRTRRIVEMQLETLYRDETLMLSIVATAGAVEPWSSAGELHEKTTQSLRIACAIPLGLVPRVVSGHQGFFLQKRLECATTAEYLEAVRNGPPKES